MISTGVSGLLEEFATHWDEHGEPPDVVAFLARHPSADLDTQLQVLLFDQEHRWRAGGFQTVEDYLADFPEIAARPELKVQLIMAEMAHQRLRGDEQPIARIEARFPDCAALLRFVLDSANSAISPTLPISGLPSHPMADLEPATVVLQPLGSESSGRSLPREPRHDRASVTNLTRNNSNSIIRGVRIGDYVIQQEIARGGMGVVFQAIDDRFHRVVALKCIQSGMLASHKEVQRFQSEAHAAAGLDHPHIVPVYDVGECDGLHYYAMGFVNGETLAARLHHGPMSPERAARLAEVLAQAVAYAHRQGIIHRDLKPGNIMLDASGQPHITDFGLAKRTHHDLSLTLSGEIIGTPNYIPPEQAAGQNHSAGPAWDIYSLGAILYSMLTGQPPFQAATVNETLQQVLKCEPVPPRRLNASIPKDLETICLKCLQKSPGKRYATAADLADDLCRFLDGQTIVARPITGIERLRRWCVNNPTVASLVALLVLITVVGCAVSVTFAVRASAKATEAEANLVRANQISESLRKERDRTNQVLYHSRIQQAYWEWKLGNIGHFNELLDACSPKDRGWEYRFLRSLPDRGHRKVFHPAGAVNCVTVTSDGQRIVSGGRDRTLRLWDIETGQELRSFLGHRGEVTCLALTQDGRWLISGSADKTVRVWELASGEQRVLRHNFDQPLKSLAVTPDGRQIVTATLDGAVKVLDFDEGRVLRTLQPPGEAVNAVVASPNGESVAGALGDSTVRLWNIHTGAEAAVLSGHSREVICLAFDPTGTTLVTGGYDSTVKIWDVATRSERHTLNGHTVGVNAVAVSSDGHSVVSGGGDQLIHEWDMKTGKINRTLRGHTRRITCVAMPPESRTVVSGSDDNLRIWQPDGEQEAAVARGHEGWVQLAAIGSKDSVLASASADHSIRLWDALSGRELRKLRETVQQVEALSFANDDQQLLAVDGDGLLYVWDVATGESRDIRGKVHDCSAAAIDRLCTRFVTGGVERTLRVWDVARGELISELPGHDHSIQCIAISPDGKFFASGDLNSVRIWDAERGKTIHVLKGHTRRIRSVVFDSTGKRLASASDDTTVRVWDVETGAVQHELMGHNSYVRSVAFSPDGQRIVSASLNTNLKLWDANTGDEVLTLRGHREAALFVLFSHDGQRIVSGSTDRTLRIWDTGSSTPASAAAMLPNDDSAAKARSNHAAP